MPTIGDNINSQYRAEIIWSVVRQDISGNRSLVRRRLQNRKTSGDNFTGYFTFDDYAWALSGGGSESGGYKYDFRDRDIVVIYEDEVWITHTADGSRSFTMSASVAMGGLGGTGTPSGTVTLPTIPRATQPTVSGPVDAGDTLTISTPRASSSFTHRLTYKFGDATGTIATDVATSRSWTVPMALLNQIPNAVSGKGTITCRTYNGSTLVGEETVSFTVRAGSAVVPSTPALAVSEAVSAVASAVGAYVQAQSRLNYAITGAAGAYGSTIKSYKLTVAGQTFTTASGTTAALAASGSLSVVATVTDSRGRTASRTVTITVLPWAPPVISNMKAQRCLQNGTLDDNGTYLKFTVTAAVTSLTVGTQKNQLRYQMRTRQRGATAWTSTALITHSGITLSAEFVTASGTYSELLSWDARFEVTDRFATSAAQAPVSVGAVALDIGPAGTGVGKRWERGALDVGGALYATRVRVTSTTDATLGSTEHGFQVGEDSGANLVIDNNEVMARNNGAPSTLNLNIDGGNLLLGDAGSTTTIPGRVANAHTAWAEAVGIVSITPATADVVASVSILFPVGRFNRAPRVFPVPATSVPGTPTGVKGVGYTNSSKDGATLHLLRGSTTATPVVWHAVQMFETSTDG
jgi:hypothetical protein